MSRIIPDIEPDPNCQAFCISSPRELGHPDIKGLDMVSFIMLEDGSMGMSIDCLFAGPHSSHHEVRWQLNKKDAKQLVKYLTKEFKL